MPLVRTITADDTLKDQAIMILRKGKTEMNKLIENGKITDFKTKNLKLKLAAFDMKESFSKIYIHRSGNLKWVFWKYCWMFWQKSKTHETPQLFSTVDEHKTVFEPHYPISILICHTLGLSWATISHHRSTTWQHIWLALFGAGPIRETWWSHRKGWEGRWDQGDVLCMGKNHALEGQLSPKS